MLVRNVKCIGAYNYTTIRYLARRPQLYKHSIYLKYIMCYDGLGRIYTHNIHRLGLVRITRFIERERVGVKNCDIFT